MSTIFSRLLAMIGGRPSTAAEAAAPAPAAVTAPITLAERAAPAAEAGNASASVHAPAADMVVEDAPSVAEEAAAAPAVDAPQDAAVASGLETPAEDAPVSEAAAEETSAEPEAPVAAPAEPEAPVAAAPVAPAPAGPLCIPAHAMDAPDGIGPLASRIGGMPWLAEDEFWPTGADGAPMTFLAQINFAEIPATEGVPAHGLLRLFVDEQPDGSVAPMGVMSIFAPAPQAGMIRPAQRLSSLVNATYPIALGFGAPEEGVAGEAAARIGGPALQFVDPRFDRAIIEIRTAANLATPIAVLAPAEKLSAAWFDEMRVTLGAA